MARISKQIAHGRYDMRGARDAWFPSSKIVRGRCWFSEVCWRSLTTRSLEKNRVHSVRLFALCQCDWESKSDNFATYYHPFMKEFDDVPGYTRSSLQSYASITSNTTKDAWWRSHKQVDCYEKYDPFMMKRDGCENARQMEYFFGKSGYVSFPDLL